MPNHPPVSAAHQPTQGEITLATLNIHSMKQGWRERAPVVLDALAECAPDVLVLQEAARWLPQPCWLAWKLSRVVPGSRYRAVTAAKGGWWWFVEGLAIVTRLPIVDSAVLNLQGNERVAQRVTIELPGGSVFDVYNLHLAHRGEDQPLRDRQVDLLLSWAEARRGRPAIVAGDFNADPDSTAIRAMSAAFRSAHVVVHGAEPRFTAPADSGPGQGRALDYIFVSEDIKVLSCDLAFGPVQRANRLVYPSDHLGLRATLRIP